MALMYTGDIKAKYAVKVSSSKYARWLVVSTPTAMMTPMIVVSTPMLLVVVAP